MRVVVTGAAGFVGRHLIRALGGLDPRPECLGWRYAAGPEDESGAHWSAVDIEDGTAVAQALRDAQPSHLVHLAALSNVADSFADPGRTWRVNAIGTLNVLEAVKRESPDTRVLLVSSSEVYGQSFRAGEALDENAPIRPMNPYAASKAAAEIMTLPYVQRGVRILIARPFNHVGPGQDVGFAIPSFAQQLAEIGAGRRAATLNVGNLDARRDFLDVSDVVAAYLGLLEGFDRLTCGSVFNVCSGIARRIGDVLQEMISLSGLPVEVVPDPSRMRPSDIPVATGNAAALHQTIGWQPQTDWIGTLRRVMDDAMARLP